MLSKNVIFAVNWQHVLKKASYILPQNSILKHTFCKLFCFCVCFDLVLSTIFW